MGQNTDLKATESNFKTQIEQIRRECAEEIRVQTEKLTAAIAAHSDTQSQQHKKLDTIDDVNKRTIADLTRVVNDQKIEHEIYMKKVEEQWKRQIE